MLEIILFYIHLNLDVFEAREYIGSVTTGCLFIKYVPYENGRHENLKEYILRKQNKTKQK